MTDYIPYGDREEWNDIEPVVQDDGPLPIVPIAYTAQFTDTMNYLRAVIQKDERSQRALDLTADVIELNAANYTCWYFRRLCIEALGSDLQAELDYVAAIATASPKNYQLWHHRESIVRMLGDGSGEKDFTAEVLNEDGKNYHAWSHRQWAIKTFDLWEGEIEYVEDMLNIDLRNNSAWNQRYFVVTRGGDAVPIPNETIEAELEFAFAKAGKSPNNQAAWNYIEGLVRGSSFAEFPQIKEKALDLKTIYSEEASSGNEESRQSAIELCDELATSLDTLRAKYWTFRKDQLAGESAA